MILAADRAPLVLGFEEDADIGQAEADHIAQAFDELQALDVLVVVAAVGAADVGSRLEQPELFVISNGALGERRRLRDIADTPQD